MRTCANQSNESTSMQNKQIDAPSATTLQDLLRRNQLPDLPSGLV